MGRRSKQTFLQRRHTDDQKAHEKMFNIANYQRNASQNYNKLGFPGGAVVESLPANAGDMGSSPGLGDLKRNDTNELIYKTETDPQTQRMNLQLPRGKGGGRDGQGGGD